MFWFPHYGSTDLESSHDKRDPDLVPNYSDLFEKSSRYSPPLPISVQNTYTSDDNAKDLSNDVDLKGVSVALLAIHTTAYDWKKIRVDYEVFTVFVSQSVSRGTFYGMSFKMWLFFEVFW